MFNRATFFLFTCSFLISCTHLNTTPKDRYWNWDYVDSLPATELAQAFSSTFSKDFQWGVAIADYQNSGASNFPRADWNKWEQNGHIHNKETSGAARDHWNRYQEDIQLIKNLNATAFRTSVEWSAIEPQEGVWDTAALQHYVDEVDALIEAKIDPSITLLHFTKPQWFADKGAFEKEENIEYFVRFCKKVFETLQSKVTWWYTINEPTVDMVGGYFRAVFPPGKCDLALGGTVLKNMLIAHTRVYDALKAMPGGDKAMIGIVHAQLKFKPFHEGNSAETFLTDYLTHVFSDAAYQFLCTGEYYFKAVPAAHVIFGGLPGLNPCSTTITYSDPSAPRKQDFIGLNYYSNCFFNWKGWEGNPAYRPEDIQTDMPYGIYAEGLYDAIADMAVISKNVGKPVPIIITENGISDCPDNGRREIWIKRHMVALACALQDGYDVRRFHYWTLVDNFEWDFGYSQQFGLHDKNRQLREGSKAYLAFTSLNQPIVTH